MANYSKAQFLMESTTFMAYFASIVSTINGSMTEEPTGSTKLSAILLDSTTESGPTCPAGKVICTPEKTTYCGNGICCMFPSGDTPSCVCKTGYKGSLCHQVDIALPKTVSSSGYKGTRLTAAVSALVGVLVIALVVTVVVLRFKYYKKRKKRSQKDDEIRKSISENPELRRNEDASTRFLSTQPGYSWRQRVKRTADTSQKSKGLSTSSSVPENLIGLTREREKEAIRTQNGDGGGGEHEGSERFCLDPMISSSSTAQLPQDKDPSTMAVQFDNKSDVIHL